jgi:hypothetical protein
MRPLFKVGLGGLRLLFRDRLPVSLDYVVRIRIVNLDPTKQGIAAG